MHRAKCGQRGRRIEQGDDLAFVGPEPCLGQLQTDLQTEARREGRPSEPQIVEGGSALAMVRSAQAKLAGLAEEREGPGQRPESAGDGAGVGQLEQVDAGARTRQRKLDLALRAELLPRRFDVAAEHGFSLPVVWNCGGYESVDALRLLDGVVDVYLPDAKYGDDSAAYELSGCRRYTAALEASLREMHRQARVIVRHLVLPAGVAAPEKLMPRIAAVSEAICVNVLSQYRPLYRASLFPVIDRGVTGGEVAGAIEAARSAGLRHILMDGRPV